MTIKDHSSPARPVRAGYVLALASLAGALAASSCCMLPLALLSAGVSGAWIGQLTGLAPYQPYIIAATVGFLALGYRRVYRSATCADGEACTNGLPTRLVTTGLLLATALMIAALGFEFLAPLLLML
jgi:mercuric ion transport protein